jgi:hypothetical protein
MGVKYESKQQQHMSCELNRRRQKHLPQPPGSHDVSQLAKEEEEMRQ